MIHAAVGNTISQGLGSALGIQSFSWRGVAAAAVTAGITEAGVKTVNAISGGGINLTSFNIKDLGQNQTGTTTPKDTGGGMATLARNVVGLVGAMAGSAVQNRGRTELRSVAIGTVGNSLGAALADQFKQHQGEQLKREQESIASSEQITERKGLETFKAMSSPAPSFKATNEDLRLIAQFNNEDRPESFMPTGGASSASAGQAYERVDNELRKNYDLRKQLSTSLSLSLEQRQSLIDRSFEEDRYAYDSLITQANAIQNGEAVQQGTGRYVVDNGGNKVLSSGMAGPPIGHERTWRTVEISEGILAAAANYGIRGQDIDRAFTDNFGRNIWFKGKLDDQSPFARSVSYLPGVNGPGPVIPSMFGGSTAKEVGWDFMKLSLLGGTAAISVPSGLVLGGAANGAINVGEQLVDIYGSKALSVGGPTQFNSTQAAMATVLPAVINKTYRLAAPYVARGWDKVAMIAGNIRGSAVELIERGTLRFGANNGSGVIASEKFKYIFGEVNSTTHNLARSEQLASQMKRLGISNNADGRAMLAEHFALSAKSEGNVSRTFSSSYGNFEVRESLFIGPSGQAAKFETTFRVNTDGTRQFSTVIPKGGIKGNAYERNPREF